MSSPPWAPKFLTRFIGNFLYLSFGFGHGCSENNMFYRANSEEKWHKREKMPKEIVKHTYIDRLGDSIALLEGRVEGVRLTCFLADHTHTLNTIKANRHLFKPTQF